MKTTSYNTIKEIKQLVKELNMSLKDFVEGESSFENATTVADFQKGKNYIDGSLALMVKDLNKIAQKVATLEVVYGKLNVTETLEIRRRDI